MGPYVLLIGCFSLCSSRIELRLNTICGFGELNPGLSPRRNYSGGNISNLDKLFYYIENLFNAVIYGFILGERSVVNKRYFRLILAMRVLTWVFSHCARK